MEEIKIKGLNPEVKLKLQALARNKSLSLNKYVINILTDYTMNPVISSTEDKYSNLVKDVTTLYQSLLMATKDQIAVNTHILAEVKEILSDSRRED